jgi:hypothetical protein
MVEQARGNNKEISFSKILIYVVPGKQVFYEKLGFGHLKTGMGLFPNPERSRNNGYLL